MEPTEDLHQRSIRLIQMIERSENVKPPIKQLFENVDQENFETKGFSRNLGEILSLYRLRYHILNEKGIHSEAWDYVLTQLAKADNSADVYLSLINIDNKIYLVFSDVDYEGCYGVIFRDW